MLLYGGGRGESGPDSKLAVYRYKHAGTQVKIAHSRPMPV